MTVTFFRAAFARLLHPDTLSWKSHPGWDLLNFFGLTPINMGRFFPKATLLTLPRIGSLASWNTATFRKIVTFLMVIVAAFSPIGLPPVQSGVISEVSDLISEAEASHTTHDRNFHGGDVGGEPSADHSHKPAGHAHDAPSSPPLAASILLMLKRGWQPQLTSLIDPRSAFPPDRPPRPTDQG